MTFCIVLLLPVSHLAYTIYCQPVLWATVDRPDLPGDVASQAADNHNHYNGPMRRSPESDN